MFSLSRMLEQFCRQTKNLPKIPVTIFFPWYSRSTAVLEVLLLLDAAAVSGVAPSAVLSVMPF